MSVQGGPPFGQKLGLSVKGLHGAGRKRVDLRARWA